MISAISDEAMKIKVIVHEPEEGGYWAEVPALPGCATQGKPSKNCLRIFTKRWKVAWRLTLKNQNRMGECWKSPYEVHLRQGVHKNS
jgi:hypothetical protein